MCILCGIQKWSRRVATMLPWLVIPLIGLWALSQLLPPAFRFEITSPRLACVFVLLVTLFWYEILMPQLSAWRVRRNARLRERKRFEAIEMQKLRKTATRRCRNCLTPYRDQNPGGGKFMCAYCGHISKRPVLDLPVPPGLGLSNSGILKDLVGKSGKILNGKAWTDNGWICGQDWLDNGNWVAGSFTGKSSTHWQKNNGGVFSNDDHCLAEKSYSRIVIFSSKALTAFFLGIMWLWRKIFRISSSGDESSVDAEQRRMLARRGENGGNCQESRGEKARRKAEEKRQARLEREQLEEEERKQREEVARLVEERRKLRDEKTEATEKDRGKGSPSTRGKDSAKKEAEKKRQERKREKDRGSSKSNSDAEEIERRAGKEERKTSSNSTEMGHVLKGNTTTNSYNRNAGSRYLDRMRGTLLSSSRAFTGGSFFGKSSSNSSAGTVSREHKPNGSLVDHFQIPTNNNRKDISQPDRVSLKSNIVGDDKNSNRPVLIEPPQPYSAPKKSWQQLFTRSSSIVPPPSSNINVISRPKSEIQSPLAKSPSSQTYDNPINFGLPSPFTLSSNFPYTSSPTSTNIAPTLPPESMFSRKNEACEFLPEESDIFEDPCYVPDPVSLLGPVSESLDNFRLDLGFITEMGLDKPRGLKNVCASAEVSRPSPIESPMSRFRVSEERQHSNSFLFPSNINNQEIHNMRMNDSNEKGTWQMWNSSPLGQDILHSVPQKSMASLFKNDDQVLPGTHSPQKGIIGNCQNGAKHSNSIPGTSDDPWLPKNMFGPIENNHSSSKHHQGGGAMKNEMIYGNLNGSASNHPFELPPINPWAKKEWTMQQQQQGGTIGEGSGNSPVARPAVGGLYSSPDVQSLWSYD